MNEHELRIWISTLRREDDCLVGSLMLPFAAGNGETEVSIEADDSPSDAQVATVLGLVERFPEIRARILDRLFRDYQVVVERYRTFYRELAEDPDANAPLVHSPEELVPLLELQSVYVPRGYGAGTFGIGFWSRWEQEHGAGVQFEKWSLTSAGEAATHFIFE